MEKELLKQLVEIPSYLDKKRGFSERKYVNFIKKFFKKNLPNYRIYTLKVEEERENLLIIPKSPKIIFCCHLDTVLPSKKNHTKLIIKKDKIYGLGTKDMKGGTVSAILATLELPKEEQEKVGFLFYCDEEREQKGMEIMVKKSNLIPKSVKYFLSPESSFKLNFGCRGYATVKVIVYGKRAHTSRVHLGINSGEIIFSAYQDLQKYFNNIKTKLGQTSITLTSLKVGVLVDGICQIQSNSVPDYAEGIFSLRLSKNIKENELIKIFKDKITKIHKLKYSVNIEQLRSPSSITKEEDLKIFLNSAKLLGFNLELSDPGFSGYNDVAMISSKTNRTLFGFGPYGEGNHGPDEWVSLHSMKDVKKIFKNFIQNIK
jgi:acetylornithine deacetylase/succinyl-diaminopimelate desuccinylase-like protein